MTEEWGPWIEHDGKGVPLCVIGKVSEVIAEHFDGTTTRQSGVIIDPTGDCYRAWNWSFFGKICVEQKCLYARVLRYRIRKPRGLLLLQKLIAEIEAPEQVDA